MNKDEIKKRYAQKFGIKMGINDFLSPEAQTEDALKFIDAWEFFETLYTSMVEGELKDFVVWNARYYLHGIDTKAENEALKRVQQYLLERKKNVDK